MSKSRFDAALGTALTLGLLASANLMAGGLFAPEFDTDNFANPLTIDNLYWPLPAETTYIYFTETEDGCEWNQVDVTLGTREIESLDTRVVLDRVWLDESEDCAEQLDNYPSGFPYGDLIEPTEDYFAQDDAGNVWYLGEHTIELNADPAECNNWVGDGSDPVFPGLNGCLDGSFIAGENEAQAGIVMMANPAKGDFYRQEQDEDNAEDWGKVLNFVPVDDYENCLVTKEWSPLEHGAIEHKYYCPAADGDYGALVQVAEVSGGPIAWTQLIDVQHP